MKPRSLTVHRRLARIEGSIRAREADRMNREARRLLGALSDEELREEIAAAGGFIEIEPRALERELGNRPDSERAAVIFEGRPDLRARCMGRIGR